MYTVHKNVQIIIALLKKYGIRHIVMSAGTRHIPVVFSAEADDFFTCYSIVDERSAGFFALGLIQTIHEPVAIVCTSGTAACNYVSAVTEAYYQHLPLVVLTSDRNQYFLNQQEDQCIPQMELYKNVCRSRVNLPIVRDQRDFWYCGRLVNEALLELDHREKGPVHINFQIDDNYPVELGTFKFDATELPDVVKIDRIMPTDPDNLWQNLADELTHKKVLLLYGQNLPISTEESSIIEEFCEKYNVALVCEHLSNLPVSKKIHNNVLFSHLSDADWTSVRPDLVITMNGQMVLNIKGRLRRFSNVLQHWHVSADGEVSDPFMCMSKIVEATPVYFFQKMLAYASAQKNEYYEQWKALEKRICIKPIGDCAVEFSSVYAVKALMDKLPDNSLLHISNSNNIRIANMFPIKETVDVYCNRGTCGIDGSLSTYIAQSYISKKPSFIMIGDLSFFYDMNALWNRYSTSNTRIMLCNNSGGALFHSSFYKQVQEFKSIDVHIAAAHNSQAEGWARSQGFEYLSAHNQEEFDAAIEKFVLPQAQKPILFEVFTDKDIDTRQMSVATNSIKSETVAKVRSVMSNLPGPVKRTVKKLLNR